MYFVLIEELLRYLRCWKNSVIVNVCSRLFNEPQKREANSSHYGLIYQTLSSIRNKKTQRPMKETHKLTIYLIKENFTTFASCLRKNMDYDLVSYELKPELNLNGIIYIAETQTKESKWKLLLQQGTNSNIPLLTNSSNRAILFLKVDSRLYCCSFGYGQYLLNPASIERNFGLKTSLNSINPDKLRSMDKAKLNELTVQTRIQSSRTTDRGSFNIDIIGDLLKSITGETLDKSLGNNITGTDAAYITPKIEFVDIAPAVTKLNGYYKLERYKESFDWIDNLEHEKNPDLIDDLNEALVEALKQKDTIKTSIAPPFITDWTNFTGISFTPKGDLTDFEIEKYYEYKDDLSQFNIDKLRASYLYFEEREDENRISMSLMKCLNFQTEVNNNLYVRTLGKWYKISKVFSDKIMEEVRRIEESTIPYIECEKDWNEGDYNEALANSNTGYSLFDRKLIRCEAVKSSIEACDVLTKDREFIHVKPKNQSSTLSHLFSQGRIAAVALNSDKEFRKKMRTIIRANRDFDQDVIPLDQVNNSDFTVTYATITKGDKGMIEKLPFFSLLNLRQSAQFLYEHGFNVKIKKIKKKEN